MSSGSEKTLENVRFGAFLGPPIIGVPGAITAKLGGWFWGRFPGRFSVFFCFSEDVFWRSFGGECNPELKLSGLKRRHFDPLSVTLSRLMDVHEAANSWCPILCVLDWSRCLSHTFSGGCKMLTNSFR